LDLTPEQKASIDKFNSLGSEITDSAMMFFMDSWFSNARALIKSDFLLHSLQEFVTKPRGRDFIVLGSGPSISKISENIPGGKTILCGPTCVGALTRYDVRPSAIVVADSNPEQYQHVLHSDISKPYLMDVILPVTADPSWYAPESIFDRSRLYFYLPYLTYMGDIDIGFNHILKALFPEVPWRVNQAGSVSNLALNVADWCCGTDPNKRIYIAVDNSWIKGGPRRAPLCYDTPPESLKGFWDHSERPRKDLIDVPYIGGVTIQSDILSLHYAIMLFYLIHEWVRDFPFKRNRYCLVEESSWLYDEVAHDVHFSVYPSESIGKGIDDSHGYYEDSWAYKVMLKLVELSNTLADRLKAENSNPKIPPGSHTPIEVGK